MMEKVALVAVSRLVEKLIDLAFDYIIKHEKRRWLGKLIRPSKPDNIIVVEYTASTDTPISSLDDTDLLKRILEDSGVELKPFDPSLIASDPNIANLIYDRWKGCMINLAFMSSDICWIVIGSVERYRDIFEDFDFSIHIASTFDELIEIYETAEEEVKEQLNESVADLIYMFNYIVIPITKKSINRTHELVDKIHWTLSKTLEIKATIKLRVYGKRLKELPKNVTVYDVEDHTVIIVYDPYTLKEILENI